MYVLDLSIDGVQNSRFLCHYHNLIRKLTKSTQFSEREVSSLLMIYHKFSMARPGVKSNYMAKGQFVQLCDILFEIHDLQIIERIFTEMSGDPRDFGPVAWVKLFDVFMGGNLEKQMKYVFKVYDAFNTGHLEREILVRGVQNYFVGEEDDIVELGADMTDLLMKKFDRDRDGVISYDDYSYVVRKQPSLMQFLGKCMPDPFGLDCIAYCANLMAKIKYLKTERVLHLTRLSYE